MSDDPAPRPEVVADPPGSAPEAGGSKKKWARTRVAARHTLAGIVLIVTFTALAVVAFAFVYRDDILGFRESQECRASPNECVAVSVGTPTVHTRERLLNDRFEQVAWLQRYLDNTLPAPGSAVSAGLAQTTKSAMTDASPPAPAHDAPVRDASIQGLSLVTEADLRTIVGRVDDPRREFQLISGYRDVLRAERARAMLDDSHDMDESTLSLFSFDATVMPRMDGVRGYAAVDVLVTRNEKELVKGAIPLKGKEAADIVFEKLLYRDLFDVYVAWLEKLRELTASNIETLATSLDGGDFFLSTDPIYQGIRNDYDITLREMICSKYLSILDPIKAHDGKLDTATKDCQDYMRGKLVGERRAALKNVFEWLQDNLKVGLEETLHARAMVFIKSRVKLLLAKAQGITLNPTTLLQAVPALEAILE